MGTFDNVLSVMAEKNISQKQLSDCLGVGESKISDWKAGRVKS